MPSHILPWIAGMGIPNIEAASTPDATPPTVSSTYPTDNATGVPATVNPTVTFSENVQFGTGNITLRDVTGAADVELFDVTTDVGTGPGKVSITTTTLLIEPTADLSPSNEYAIRIAATAIDDIAGNSFAGIADDTTFSFTTASASAVVYGQQDPADAPGPTEASADVDSPAGTQLATTGSTKIYVDVAATGANNGTSLANAYTNITAAMSGRSPGNVIIVKDGTYRESVSLAVSGSSGNNIVLTRYGTDRPIISGAALTTGWAACSDQADAGGNANWASMYRAYIPAAQQVLAPEQYNLCQSGVRMHLTATGPGFKTGGALDTTKLEYGRNTDYFRDTGSTFGTSVTSITDSDATEGLGQFSADSDLADAIVVAHNQNGNNTKMRVVTGFTASTDTITFAAITDSIGVGPEYSVQNVVKLIDGAGQWAFKRALEGDGTRKVWCWPYDTGAMDAIEISVRKFGLNVADKDYWTIYGIDAVQTSGGTVGGSAFTRDGNALGTYNNNAQLKQGIIIEECRVAYTANTTDGGGASSLSIEYAADVTIRNCSVEYVQNMHGIVTTGSSTVRASNIEILNCHVSGSGGTGIRPHTGDGVVMAWNKIDNVIGAHANGASVYGSPSLSAKNYLVYGNVIRSEQGIGFTHQFAGNMYFCFNDVQAPHAEALHRGIEDNKTSDIPEAGNFTNIYINNTCGPAPTVTLSDSSVSLTPGKTSAQTGYTCTAHVVNNVAHGGLAWEVFSHGTRAAKGTYENNVLTGTVAGQSGSDTLFVTDANNTLDLTVANSFKAYASEDYRPVLSGNLDSSGASHAAIRATVEAAFPAFFPGSVWLDVEGTTVNWVDVQIGAYQTPA